jgi:putative nucleotidyltransferase with HDIG domain
MKRVGLPRFSPAQAAVLRAVADEIGPGSAFLVGGAVRDVLLGRRFHDLDVTVSSGACALARRVAERAGGAYVELDAERGAARAVLPADSAQVHLDVTDLRGPTLDEDLARRDFTINAIAVPVGPLARDGAAGAVDPRGGLDDLARRRLRLAGPDSIADDPVRALRGIRLEAQLRFRLDPRAVREIRREAPALARIAAERITQELLEILRLTAAAPAFRRADRLGVLAAVLPEAAAMRGVSQPAPHRFDVLEHSLRAVAATDRLVAEIARLAPWGEVLAEHLAESLGGGFSRREVLKLAALLHDVSKPETRAVVDGRIRFFGHDILGARRVQAIGERLRLPARAIRVLETLVRYHLRLMHLEQAGAVTRRARYRFFRDVGDDARDLLLLTLVDAAAVNGASPLAVWRRSTLARELMAGWREDSAAQAEPPLLHGEDVMEAFGLAPGPEVGRLLGLAREAQHLGLVATRDEALAYLRSAREPDPLPPGETPVV